VNPPSHLLVNAALRKRAGNAGIEIPRGAFLLGALLPDLPLTILWIGTFIYMRYLQGDQTFTLMDQRLDQLYFTDPLWIAGHNTLHSPLILLSALFVLRRFRNAPGARGRWWFWFAAGCLVHTLLDIPTHVNDGPLLLFPLDWSTRFQSPISYWDPRHYGREFAIFELLLDIALLAYVGGPWLRRKLQRRAEA
jgi:hypothetical protein